MDDQELSQIDRFNEITIDASLREGFTLADVLVFPNRGVIVRQQEHHHVSPKAMEVLFVLSCCSGRIVTRKAILGYVWGAKRASSSTISSVVTELRHLLDDHKECPTFIQTLPRKGYRLLLPPIPMQDSILSAEVLKAAANLDDADLNNSTTRLFKSVEHWRHSRLFKVAGTYIVMAWLLIQVVAVAIPVIDAPEWFDKLVLIALVLGFPATLGYNWWAELKLRKTFARKHNNPEAEPKISQHAYQDLGLISLLSLCCFGIVMVLANQVVAVIQQPTKQVQTNTIEAQFYPNAVAVMPFETIGELSTGYSIALLQSEMTAFLSQSSRLKIISERVLASIPKNSSLSTIRKWTGAKYILEGKVNQQDQLLRINTSLIDSETGHQVWANTMSVQTSDQLSLYARISQQAVNALTFILPQDKGSELQYKPTQDIHAYDFYIQAKTLMRDAYNEQQLKQAEQLFLNALQRDSQFALAQVGLCQTYLEQYTLMLVSQIFELARNACQGGTAEHKNIAEYHIALGRLFYVSGEYKTANQYFDQALERQPDNSIAMIGKAQTLSKLQLTEQAEGLYVKAITSEPGYWRNYEEYGRYLFETGRFYDASLQFEKQTVLSPNSEEAFNNLGAAYYLIGRFELATKSYQKALAIKPSANVYSNLGTSLFFSRQFDQAAKMYRNAVALNPGQFFLRGNYADALKFSGADKLIYHQQYRLALQQAQQSLVINAKDVAIRASESRYLSELDMCNEANTIAAEILRISSNDPYVYYDLALVDINCNEQSEVLLRIDQTLSRGYSVKLLLADPQFEHVKSHIHKNYEASLASI